MTDDKTKPDPAGCCEEMLIHADQCCCGSMMKKHPWAASLVCGFMGLLMLTVITGAILGIIAFIRTL